MSVAKKGRRKIWVNGDLYLWEVRDQSQNEGFWWLIVTADSDWQKRFAYPLDEVELRQLASDPDAPPLPEQFDKVTMKLRDAVTTKDYGCDRHVHVTPRFVRMLIEWHIVNVWQNAPRKHSEPGASR